MKTELIVALDVSSASEAYAIVDKLSARVRWFKVGSILFTREGKDFVTSLKDRGYSVFLDLKFFDIPNTVKGVCEVVAEMGVDMFTIHMLGGIEMARAALQGISRFPQSPLVLGVTVLTSMDEKILRDELRMIGGLDETVTHLVRQGLEAGLRGFVCSPQELVSLRSWVPTDTVVVTPGVRLAGEATGDQKRVMTPGEAHRYGANYLVMGRSIYGAPDPLEVVDKVLAEIET